MLGLNKIVKDALTNETKFIYETPPDTKAKVVLLTTGKVAIVGPWGDGTGVIAWHPLPKRHKQTEERLGY